MSNPTVSGDAAISWMRGRIPLGSNANVPGDCLRTVWMAYGSHDSIGAHAGQYPDAIDGWLYATQRHPGDMNPPAGFPVYFDVSPTRTDSNARAGDVVLSVGGGMVIGTDVGGAGHIGITSISARAAAISRPYLGWTEDFLGYDVVTTDIAATSATPLTTPAPAPEPIAQEDDMPYILSSPRGQSFHTPNLGFPINADAVQTIRGDGSTDPKPPVIAVPGDVHQQILNRQAQKDGLPLIVNAPTSLGGDGSIYTLEAGKLTAFKDASTIRQLINQGAPQIDASPAEIANLQSTGGFTVTPS